MATNLDEQEAALYLGMMQLYEALDEALGQMLDRKAHLQEKELIKQEPKAPKCASCGTTEGDIETSKWAMMSKPRFRFRLCYLCELEAEDEYYAAEAMEVTNEGSI